MQENKDKENRREHLIIFFLSHQILYSLDVELPAEEDVVDE